MKIETAIEILTTRSRPRHQYYDPKELPAIKLGIEALKRLQQLRKIYEASPYQPLPGESVEWP